MGFSVFCETFEPIILLQTFFVGFTRYLLIRLFTSLGLSQFIQPDDTILHENTSRIFLRPPITRKVIEEALPVVKYKELEIYRYSTDQSCAICLSEFEAETEIRLLKNCKHIFHTSCLDRWMHHDRNTCPLCRTSFVHVAQVI